MKAGTAISAAAPDAACVKWTMRRPWTDEDIAKLQSMARRYPTEYIAKELGRGVSATVMMAHSLRISLRPKPKQGCGLSDVRPSFDEAPDA